MKEINIKALLLLHWCYRMKTPIIYLVEHLHLSIWGIVKINYELRMGEVKKWTTLYKKEMGFKSLEERFLEKKI